MMTRDDKTTVFEGVMLLILSVIFIAAGLGLSVFVIATGMWVASALFGVRC
jgi:hypothetical protein